MLGQSGIQSVTDETTGWTNARLMLLKTNEFVFVSKFAFDTSRPITVVLAGFTSAIGSGAPTGSLAAASILATLRPDGRRLRETAKGSLAWKWPKVERS